MNFWGVIKSWANALKSIVVTGEEQDTTPEGFKKGEAFENFLRKQLFTDADFALVHKTRNYQSNSEDFEESSLNPDFRFRFKASPHNTKIFDVEAKYRSGFWKPNQIYWCKEFQLKRYRDIENTSGFPIFIAIGLGGQPDNPEMVFIIPLKEITSCILDISDIERFSIEKKAVVPTLFVQFAAFSQSQSTVQNAHTRTGYCIRTGAAIPFNTKKPMSDTAFQSWSRYSNPDYAEKYCHYSGEESKGETTFSKPILRKNWVNAKRDFGL